MEIGERKRIASVFTALASSLEHGTYLIHTAGSDDFEAQAELAHKLINELHLPIEVTTEPLLGLRLTSHD
jgi:hypothetical protein